MKILHLICGGEVREAQGHRYHKIRLKMVDDKPEKKKKISGRALITSSNNMIRTILHLGLILHQNF
jgi:hypothetical protein